MGNRVDEYIEGAPEAQRGTLRELRAMIRAAIPVATETMGVARFPVYEVEGAWVAGFAARPHGAVLYLMDPPLLDEFEGHLGGLRAGPSCIEWRGNEKVTLETLRVLAQDMLGQLPKRLKAAS